MGVSEEPDSVGVPIPNPAVTSLEITGDMPSLGENQLREGFGNGNALRAEAIQRILSSLFRMNPPVNP